MSKKKFFFQMLFFFFFFFLKKKEKPQALTSIADSLHDWVLGLGVNIEVSGGEHDI
jgi:hypothetical protein